MPRATYNSLAALAQDPQYGDAMHVFELIQHWGAANIPAPDDPPQTYTIDEVIGNDSYWTGMGDDQTRGDIHMYIGWMIAHHWPFFAQAFTEPVYITFDYSDATREGHYRFATYRRG